VREELRVENGELKNQPQCVSSRLKGTDSARASTPGRGVGGEGLVRDFQKCLATPVASIHGEMDRISQQLTSRLRELAKRHDRPLPKMAERLNELESKVYGHLKRMGFAWQ